MSSQDRSTESLLADTALATGETVAAGTDGMVGGGLRAHQLSADDRYRASSLLGVGGMGEVLLYRDGRIGRDVAVKRLRGGFEGSAEALKRFVREARVQGQLEHPSVVPVYDMATDQEGAFYFTMRRIRGRTLADILAQIDAGDAEARARYSLRRLLTLFSAICQAVAYAHSRGVVHRDLKPSNVMVGEFGEVYVLDWGIAKIQSEREDETELPLQLSASVSHATKSGSILGTIGYMAPEQLLGLNDAIDARADVYSLGLVLFQVLVRRAPFEGVSGIGPLLGAMQQGLPAPSSIDPSIAPELDALVLKAAAYERTQRHQTAQELSEAIERYLDGERDDARRRELASAHITAAEQRAARAEGRDDQASQQERVEAMSELLKALALAPDDERARGALLRLLTHVPSQLPPAVQAEMARAGHEARMRGLRLGIAIYLSWLLVIGYTLFMGIRSWPMFFWCAGLVVLIVVVATTLYLRKSTGLPSALTLAALTFIAIASFSVWLGPFVLVPVACAGGSLVFSIQLDRRIRPWVIGMAVLASVVPFFVEWLGVLPPAYEFRAGEVALLARAVEISPRWTTIGLIYISVAFTFVPPFYMGLLRDALSKAEERLFLHTWHFEQLTRALSGRPQPPAK